MHDSSINGHIGVGRTGHQGRVSAPVVGECGPKRDLQQEAGGGHNASTTPHTQGVTRLALALALAAAGMGYAARAQLPLGD